MVTRNLNIFIFVLVFILSQKQMLENRKINKSGKTYLGHLPETWHYAAQLAGQSSWLCQSSSPLRQEDAKRVADARRCASGHLLLAASL